MQRSRGCRFFQISRIFKDSANGRICGPFIKSLKFDPYGAVVSEHMDDSAACTSQDRPSKHGAKDHVESRLDGSQCGCESVDRYVATQSLHVLEVLVVAVCPVDALARATVVD